MSERQKSIEQLRHLNEQIEQLAYKLQGLIEQRDDLMRQLLSVLVDETERHAGRLKPDGRPA